MSVRGRLSERLRRGLVFRLLWLISTGIAATVRFRVEGWDKLTKLVSDGKGGLVLPWHGVTMLPIYYCRNLGFYSLVSLSNDGDLQDKLLRSRGFKTVRGSSGRGGARALLELTRKLQEGGVMAHTPDGPKGPPKKVQPGTVYLARRSGCPILPVGVACRPCKRLSSWDSHMIPAPFARAVMLFGDPLYVTQDEDDAEASARIGNAIDDAERRAWELLGAKRTGGRGLTFLLYNSALLLLSLPIAAYILYRILTSGKSRNSWRQQLGAAQIPDEVSGRNRVWIHAVSVGESVASAAVIHELKQAVPDAAVLVSTTTEKGQEMAHKSIKDADGFFYYPFDLVPCVTRSLNRVRPVVFASTDTEIWPNLLHLAHRRGVKTAMINGTVSDKTLRGSRWIPWLYRWALSNIERFCMQSQADADRVISLGADPARVIVTGNCKADEATEPMSDADKAALTSTFKFLAENLVFVAGSTNPGEDAPVMDALIAARADHPSLRLIIAPRQIERMAEICGIAKDKGLACGWRSDPSTIAGAEDVVILDTFGELGKVYAIADVTFVGGSLIPKGCHSILQPISQGKPVFFGPYTFKAKDLVAQAKAAGVGFEVRDGAELGREIARMLASPDLLSDIRSRCERMMQANLGASKRTADELVKLLAPSPGGEGWGEDETAPSPGGEGRGEGAG